MADGKVIIDSKLDNSGLDKGLSEMQGKLKSVGGKMKDIGKNMTKNLTLPIVAAGTGALLMASNFDDSMRKVKATMGETLGKSTKEADANFKALREEAMKLGATTAHSASDASAAMKELAQMGYDTNEILAATPIVLDTASAAGLELDFVASTLASSMNQFGVEVDKEGKNVQRFGDVMVRAGQISGTSMEEIAQSLEYVGSSAANAGMDIEQTSAFIGVLGDNGITGSKAGTALNAMFSDMKNKVKKGNLEFGKFNVKMYDGNGKMRDMTDIMADVEKGLEGMSDEQKDAAINAVFGRQSQQALNAILGEGTDSVKDYEKQLRNANGTSKKAAEEMEGGIGGSLRNLKSATEGLAIELGDVLAPMVQKVADFISDLMNKFSGLSDETKETVVKIGLFLAVLGPILTILGAVFSVIGTVTTAVGVLTGSVAAATGAAGGLATVLGFLASPAGLAVLAIGGIVAVSAQLVNHLKGDAIPEIDRFGDSVSENTQEAVGAFMDMSEEADVALKSLVWSQQEVTSKMATDMKEQQENITNTLLEAINDRHEQEKEETIANFENINILNDAQKERLLAGIDERFEEESKVTQEGHDRILEIQELASKEGRAITHAESEEILSIRNNMTEQSVKIMSENEAEQKVILEKMKENATTLSAQEAAEVVKNSNEKKKGVIKEADEQFDKTVEWAIRQRDETGELSAEEARAVMQEAKTKRDESVKSAEDMHNKVVREAKNQAKEHVNEVDWSTGEIKSKWQVMVGKISDKMDEIGKNVKEGWSKAHKSATEKINSMKEKVSTGFTKMLADAKTKNKETSEDVKKRYEEMKQNMSNKMSEAKENVGRITGEIVGKVKGKAQDMVNAGKDLINGLIQGIKNMKDNAINAITGVVDGVVNKAKSFLKIKSPSRVFKEIGEFTVDGLTEGINSKKKEAENATKRVLDEMIAVTKKANADIKKLRGKSAKEAQQITSDKNKRLAELRAEEFKIAKDWIDYKKNYEEYSMYQQYKDWEKVQKKYKVGSDERKVAENELLQVKKNIHSELTNINDSYLKQVQDLNKQLIGEENKLNAEYESALDSRAKSYYSFAGIFDEVKASVAVSGEDLMSNLQGQVDSMANWVGQIETLAVRGIDEGLLEELRAMGPKAANELAALNSLTDEQLEEYTVLWQSKNNLARKQAERELVGMKDDTKEQIDELHKQTESQLDELQKEWQSKINEIRFGTKDEFNIMTSDLKEIGKNSIEGMIEGLSSMEGALMAKAQSIADGVRSTISSALDIHSPSRWMRDHIGKNMMLGWIKGIDAEKTTMLRKSKEMTEWMKPSVAGIGNLKNVQVPLNNFGSYGPTTNNSSSLTQNSKTYGDTNITIVSPANTPSENSRQFKRTMKELGRGY